MTRREELLLKCKQLLADSGLPPSVINRSPEMLQRRLTTFLQKPENRDGRGVKANVNKTVLVTLRHLCRAVACADGRDDPAGRYGSVRTDAKSLVRSLQSVPFEELQVKAKCFAGKMNRAGELANETVKRQQAEATRIDIGEGWALVPILSSHQLEQVGRKLSLCVAYKRRWPGRHYHKRLRSGCSEFWLLKREDEAYGLLEVDVEEEGRVVAEASAKGNETLELTRRQALRILKALNATADEEESFSNVGAYSPFIRGTRSADAELTLARHSYRVWWSSKQRLLTVKRKGREAWSLFTRERSTDHALPTWEKVGWGNALERSQLPSLLILIERQCPELGKRLSAGVTVPSSAVSPPSTASTGPAPRRPRRDRRLRRPRRRA